MLCLDHHSDATGNQGLGSDYSQREIRLFKQNWEEQCHSWLQSHENSPVIEEDPQPLESLYKKIILDEGEVESYRFNLEKDEQIVFNFSSDEPIDFMIMAQPQYVRWDAGEQATTHEEDLGILARHDTFEAPRKGWWAVVFYNRYEESAELEYDIAVWPED